MYRSFPSRLPRLAGGGLIYIQQCFYTVGFKSLDTTSDNRARHADFDCTHSAIPPKTKPMPIQVSKSDQPSIPSTLDPRGDLIPREITLPSAHHSPKTVNKKASEFVIGTVRLNSIQLSAEPTCCLLFS